MFWRYVDVCVLESCNIAVRAVNIQFFTLNFWSAQIFGFDVRDWVKSTNEFNSNGCVQFGSLSYVSPKHL